MATIELTQALQTLNPHLAPLHEAAEGGWSDYQGEPAHSRSRHSARTQASAVHDYTVHRARETFEGKSGVRVVDLNGLFLLQFEHQIVVRFKKLDEWHRSTGIPTRQRMRFMYQHTLPGMPPLAHLEVGYELTPLRTMLAGIYLVCPISATRNLWEYALSGGRPSAQILPLPLPAPTGPTVRLRPIEEEKKRDEGKD